MLTGCITGSYAHSCTTRQPNVMQRNSKSPTFLLLDHFLRTLLTKKHKKTPEWITKIYEIISTSEVEFMKKLIRC